MKSSQREKNKKMAFLENSYWIVIIHLSYKGKKPMHYKIKIIFLVLSLFQVIALKAMIYEETHVQSFVVAIAEEERTETFLRISLCNDNLYLIETLIILQEGYSIEETISVGNYFQKGDTVLLKDERYEYEIIIIDNKQGGSNLSAEKKTISKKMFYNNLEIKNIKEVSDANFKINNCQEKIKLYRKEFLNKKDNNNSILSENDNYRITKSTYQSIQRKIIINSDGSYAYFLMGKLFSQGYWSKERNQIKLNDSHTGYLYTLKIIGNDILIATDLSLSNGIIFD